MPMTTYEQTRRDLVENPRKWLITGVAGFIGSHLLEGLLRLGQEVVGLDNYATGKPENLAQVKESVSGAQWKQFGFIEGDIANLKDCDQACCGADYVLHQAGLGSVPRSIKDPIATNQTNVTGFLNMLVAARNCRVKRFVYASSSSVYGDNPDLPKLESVTGTPLSPYAVTKRINESYAEVFARAYGMSAVGLRYFNVFGPRQDPNGPYAAVIPRWIAAMLEGRPITIFGDGSTSRDFCYVENVVQANILAATAADLSGHEVFNIAVGARTTLNELFWMLHRRLSLQCPHLKGYQPRYEDFRPGDVRHSQADISKAGRLLGYEPAFKIEKGLESLAEEYVRQRLAPQGEKTTAPVPQLLSPT
jgi:UDP-N-acetylglucosamine 4-epimerase